VHLGARSRRSPRPRPRVARRAPRAAVRAAVQQSQFDPSRAPPGKHTAMPTATAGRLDRGSDGAGRGQIERFAPGFRDLVLARHVTRTADLARDNPNYLGGAITGGVADLFQLFTRPVARLDRTDAEPAVFLCSASTPPGGGVHGMCGYHAARSAGGGSIAARRAARLTRSILHSDPAFDDSPTRYARRVQLIVARTVRRARSRARARRARDRPACVRRRRRGDHVCVGHLVELEDRRPTIRAGRRGGSTPCPCCRRCSGCVGAPRDRAAARGGEAPGPLHVGGQRVRCRARRRADLSLRPSVCGGGPPVRRLWISSLTDAAIRRGFAALRPGAQLDALGDAARSRSEADWLVGMNATRAITARGRAAGHTALYSIGRVQTPTLAMLVSREHAIQAFVPRPYWELRGDFTTRDGQRFSAGWRLGRVARVASAAIAEAIVTRDAAAADGRTGSVERIRARTTREPAPLLFDLTALQRTATSASGSAPRAPSSSPRPLYERHQDPDLPRTDARHLSSDVWRAPGAVRALAAVPDHAAFAQALIETPPRPAPGSSTTARSTTTTRSSDHHPRARGRARPRRAPRVRSGGAAVPRRGSIPDASSRSPRPGSASAGGPRRAAPRVHRAARGERETRTVPDEPPIP